MKLSVRTSNIFRKKKSICSLVQDNYTTDFQGLKFSGRTCHRFFEKKLNCPNYQMVTLATLVGVTVRNRVQ